MNISKYCNRIVLAVFCTGLLWSCDNDIKIGENIDENIYQHANRIEGMLVDRNTNKNESLVELYSDKHESNLSFRLTKKPQEGVDVKIEYDASYLEKYNAERGTEFKPYPQALVSLARDGVLLLAPDETVSANVGITITAGNELEKDVTYAIPLRANILTPGVEASEQSQHMVYMVKDMRHVSDTYKGIDAVKNVLYFEVNDVNPLNALEFVLENSGKLFFDHLVLFSANINYNSETGRVYVYNNPNVQFLLDNNETYLQPLRKRGIKVILGILGNHDAAGVAQLSEVGAVMFAQELAAYCKAYNLDGVGFDDEYSKWPDTSNPLFAYPSEYAASRLLYETKKAMPDKIVMVYYLGLILSSLPDMNGLQPNEFVDYAVADYGLAAGPTQGMTKKNCSGMSIELNRGYGDATEATARRIKQDGYGYYMFFALDPSKYGWQVDRCQSACRGLYNDELLYPTHYYKKNDPVRYPLNQ